MKLTTIVALLGTVCTLAASAQDGLYAPRTAGDTVFVRVANMSTGEYGDIDVGPIRYRTPAPGSAGPYRPVAPGIYMAGSPSESVLFTPDPGSFATIVITPDRSLVVISDEKHSDPARAQLVVYNFSGGTIDFESRDPAAMLVPGVAPGASGTIVVNAVSLEPAATRDGEVLAHDRIRAERGASYSLFVSPDGGFIVEASVAAE